MAPLVRGSGTSASLSLMPSARSSPRYSSGICGPRIASSKSAVAVLCRGSSRRRLQVRSAVVSRPCCSPSSSLLCLPGSGVASSSGHGGICVVAKERELCILKEIAEGTYKTKHAECRLCAMTSSERELMSVMSQLHPISAVLCLQLSTSHPHFTSMNLFLCLLLSPASTSPQDSRPACRVFVWSHPAGRLSRHGRRRS